MTSFAEEADNFSPRPTVPSAAPEINRLINDHLNIFVTKYNEEKYKTCDKKEFQEKVFQIFGRNFSVVAHKISNIAKKNDFSEYKIQSYGSRNKEDTVYRATSVKGCCEKNVNIEGIHIGIDKIDHFFGNGSLLWKEYIERNEDKKKWTEIALLAERQEHVGWGLAGMGVKSYADISAHWKGFKFYTTFQDDFFKCNKGVITRTTKKFKIEEYVDITWDESINCSSFSNRSNLEAFITNLEGLKKTCPTSPSICKKISEEYLRDDPDAFQIALSPVCKGTVKLEYACEKEDSSDWKDLKNYAGGVTLGKVADFVSATSLLDVFGSKIPCK